jgi:hypothetical protein
MMKWFTIKALVGKDLLLFFRNSFFAFITILGLVAYVILYLLLPDSIDEMIGLGVYAPVSAGPLIQGLEEEGEGVIVAASEAALRQAVLDGEVAAGIAFPDNLSEVIGTGARMEVTVYLAADAPEEMRAMAESLVEAMILGLSGTPLNINVNEETLGPDLVGQQIPYRDRMVPLFAVTILMFETMGLSALLAQEMDTRTIKALLITPMGVRELLFSKGLVSILLTMSQAILLMLVLGGFRHHPLIVLTILLLGSLLVTGIGFLLAATGKDLLSVMGVGILVIILLSIPPVGVIFPGLLTGWARLIPSHYLADSLHKVINLGAGWGQVWQSLLILLGFVLVFFWLGSAVLRRKFT